MKPERTATMVERMMPPRLDVGRSHQTPMMTPLHRYRCWVDEGRPADPHGRRVIMGYALPTWQRPLVWTQEQQVRFLESAWKGLNLGTFSYNRTRSSPHPLDDLLIDGQQRMWSLQQYLEDAFPVFGYRWSEITDADRRGFQVTRTFGCYETQSEDEDYLRSYYDLMNFGGVAHTEDQRATGAPA